MLFDLQSRRRRTAVKIIYAFLALLMAGGLVLLGVGVGNGNGGLLNAFSNNGSGGNSAQNSLISQEVRGAEAKVKANPNSAAAWASLVQARWQAAGTGTNFNQSTSTFTDTGKTQLKEALSAYSHYTSLVKGKPDASTVLLAAQASVVTADYSGAVNAWQDFISAEPGQIKGYECLALTAYANKNKSLGDQASAKAVALTKPLQRLTTKQLFTQAKSSTSVAQQVAQADC